MRKGSTKRSAVLPSLFFFICLSMAQADWKDLGSTELKVAPPPAPGSSKEKKELKELISMQNHRSEHDCVEARKQSIPNPMALFPGYQSVGGSAASKKLFNDVYEIVAKITGRIKKLYARERPYDQSNQIHPCIEPLKGQTSYPSSHASFGTVTACIVTNIAGLNIESIQEQGERVGELRLIAGVHHRSDVETGREIGYTICKMLLNESDFVREATLAIRH